MRIFATIFMLTLCSSLLTGCTKGNEVSGRSLKSANRSVSRIKDRLPVEKRIEFEVSYWTVRDSIKNSDEFLSTVDGKTPEELIALGKDIFQQRKNSGYSDYIKYNNWEQMIAHFTQQRIDQTRRKKQEDPRNKNDHTILYKL